MTSLEMYRLALSMSESELPLGEKRTRARVAAWTPESGLNAEELGEHFEGDIVG